MGQKKKIYNFTERANAPFVSQRQPQLCLPLNNPSLCIKRHPHFFLFPLVGGVTPEINSLLGTQTSLLS